MSYTKEQIIDILKDGCKNARKLSDKILKERVIDLFNKLEKAIDEEIDNIQIGFLARRLALSILDALNFHDTENLQEEELLIRNEVEVMCK